MHTRYYHVRIRYYPEYFLFFYFNFKKKIWLPTDAHQIVTGKKVFLKVEVKKNKK